MAFTTKQSTLTNILKGCHSHDTIYVQPLGKHSTLVETSANVIQHSIK